MLLHDKFIWLTWIFHTDRNEEDAKVGWGKASDEV